MSFIFDVIAQGLAYGLLAIGVYITYQVLDYADLTVEGSFPFGAAICAVCITNGMNPFLSLPVAFVLGSLVGLATGILHVKFNISSLLSGILVMTGMYSVNLMVTGYKANINFFQFETIFTYGKRFSSNPTFNSLFTIGILLVLVIAMKLLLDWFLKTKYGFLMRITGDNPQLVSTLGIDIGKVKIAGLALSNAYAALSGAVVCQFLRYFDINISKGIVVIGLASVIIGLSVFKKVKFVGATTAVVVGAIGYRCAIAAALNMGLNPSNLNLMMVILFIIVLVVTNNSLKQKFINFGSRGNSNGNS
ncbi:MAG: ABC transporter permease [Erysipelotrichaceae bacterium]